MRGMKLVEMVDRRESEREERESECMIVSVLFLGDEPRVEIELLTPKKARFGGSVRIKCLVSFWTSRETEMDSRAARQMPNKCLCLGRNTCKQLMGNG